jgi:hypothetical protein
MPMGTALIIAGIVAAFAIYATALAWADFYSRNYRQPH